MPNEIIRDGTTALLPICSVCGERMSRSGRALQQIRENPHVFDGWTHRQCRNGTARPTTTRTARVNNISPIVFNTINITLDKNHINKNIDIKKYEDMFIGVELEFDNLTPQRAKEILNFQHPLGKTNGKTFKRIIKDAGSIKVEMETETDLYKESELISQIYRDGSIESEVVLRPLRLTEWDKVADIHKKLKNAGADFYYHGKGGAHLTFLLNQHAELSEFDKEVAKNLIQFSRMFYWDLVLGFGERNKTRQTGYRELPQLSNTETLSTQHYTAISLRKNAHGKIWGIEVRFPDGTNNFNHLLKQVKFWSAVIRKCAKISKYGGLMNFPQNQWDGIRNFRVERANNTTNEIKAHCRLNPQIEKILKNDLDFFNYYDVAETEEQYTQAQAQIETELRGE